MRRRNWTKRELILAMNLYCKLPFGRYHQRNPEVIELARLLGRTPGAVAMKLSNFARMDPVHRTRGVKGLAHGAKTDEEVWLRFHEDWEELAFESERILYELKGESLTEKISEDFRHLGGKEREALIRRRVNQGFFRRMVLASYRYRCTVCALPEVRLLEVSHIVPWSVDPRLRMDPQNGMAMCALHHCAFDAGLMTIDKKYRVVLSSVLSRLSDEPAVVRGFLPYEGERIRLPDRWSPAEEYFAFHRMHIFVASGGR